MLLCHSLYLFFGDSATLRSGMGVCVSPQAASHCGQELKLVVGAVFPSPSIGWDRLRRVDSWCFLIVGLMWYSQKSGSWCLDLTDSCNTVGGYLRFGPQLAVFAEEMLISARCLGLRGFPEISTFRVRSLNLDRLHIFHLHSCELSRISPRI